MWKALAVDMWGNLLAISESNAHENPSVFIVARNGLQEKTDFDSNSFTFYLRKCIIFQLGFKNIFQYLGGLSNFLFLGLTVLSMIPFSKLLWTFVD